MALLLGQCLLLCKRWSFPFLLFSLELDDSMRSLDPSLNLRWQSDDNIRSYSLVIVVIEISVSHIAVTLKRFHSGTKHLLFNS